MALISETQEQFNLGLQQLIIMNLETSGMS